MSVLIFNGTSSASVNAHITEPPEYPIPEREYESIHIAGRNGDLLIDSGTYSNIDVSYKMSMDATKTGLDYHRVASSIATWLHPLAASNYGGYFKLQDSYDPTHFRLAKFKGDEEISNIFGKAGEFDLKFECKPQRFLVSGESVAISGAGNLTNSTAQIALPKITINATAANGYIRISNSTYGYYCQITSTATGSTVVDSSEEDCYSGSTNRNGVIRFYTGSSFNQASYEFPKLYPGTNTIALSNATISLIPNWWEL